ncbi:MAG: diaminopimelate epimerase [bacterium]|nr:diaminopimelate epimerase [bacterium]
MNGSGNDFIVMDNREANIPTDLAWVQAVCRRKFGVGADGLLLAELSEWADLKMRVINADGSEAEMCGNGARCMAYFAHFTGMAESDMLLETLAGPVRAEVKDTRVKVKLTEPADIDLTKKIELAERGREAVAYLNTGVPHTVLVTRDVERAEVVKLGRQIRYHPAFQPQGTNVDFIEIESDKIKIRTYERGVEDETLSCGTGSVAGAIVAYLLGFLKPPVSVETRSGEVLTVYFKPEGSRVKEVYLEGDVQVVYRGELDIK